MQIILSARLLRRMVMLAEVAVLVALLVWISKTYLAGAVADEPTVQNLQRAARLDPGNSEYQLKLARLFQFDVREIDVDQATQHLRRAAELNPRDPQAWLELGAALALQQKTAEAEACLRRADFLAPKLTSVQWAIGNFLLLQGNVDEALRHFRVVLAGTDTYNDTVFNIAWKATDDPNKILEELIPRQTQSEFDYLNYLVSREKFTEAESVWKRIMNANEPFPPHFTGRYIQGLIAAGQPSQAAEVWGGLRKKGLIGVAYVPSSRNLVVNGDFEAELMNMGFDWRVRPLENAYAGIDTTVFHSPGHSLFVQFKGTENIYYRHAAQYVRVAPGRRYRLRALMKTEAISTDSGPRIEVHDLYDRRQLDEFTEDLTGTNPGWVSLTLDFRTSLRTELVVVSLVRLPSRKLDNRISGRLWLDDVSLVEVQEPTRQASGH